MTSVEKGVAIGLFASLLLNAFLVGGIVTHWARGHEERFGSRPALGDGHHPRRERPFRRGPAEAQLLRDVVRASGGPTDGRVRAALGEGRQRMQAHRKRMDRAEGAVREALSAQPYDEARLTASLTDLRRAAETGQAEAQETLVRLAAQLRPTERAELRGQASPPARP